MAIAGVRAHNWGLGAEPLLGPVAKPPLGSESEAHLKPTMFLCLKH